MVPLLFALLQMDPAGSLQRWMEGIAQSQLNAREQQIAQVKTRAEAEERQRAVRAKILDMLGGLPDYKGPLNAHVVGRIDAGGYTIEKVFFESLPHYYVTANLYLPKTAGPHPGILFSMGHWEQGKPVAQRMGGNLALKGFVVLAYDPAGQGEREQAYDARTGASLAGGSTTQHLLNGAQSILIGESFARYPIWDAKRALDYLVSRPEVDAGRLGATGCSGGGTLTTYISALDDRIKVAAPACYMNSWRMLYGGPTGDAEQTFAGFLAAGLDQTDYVELFAPKPWLMASTEKDFFTPAGAQVVYDEAQHWYKIFDADGRVKWVVGPGGHGTPLVVREAIYEWMIRWLKDGKGTAKEQEVQLRPDRDFQVTKSGQVATDLHSRETYELIHDQFEQKKRTASSAGLAEYVGKLVAHHAAEVERGADGGLSLEVDKGLVIAAQVSTPAGASQANATLFVGRNAEMEEMARQASAAGEVVLWLNPRGTPAGRARDMVGDWIPNARAMVIGRNLPAMRAHDILCGVDVLAGMKEVNPARIRVVAADAGGIWALLAAAADRRIAKLELLRTPHSLRDALNVPLTRGLYEGIIPGFAARWDLSDLAGVIGRDRVVWRDPVNWMRNVIAAPGAEYSTFAQ